MIDFKNKRILITGANGRLGRKLVNFFKSQNCYLILLSFNKNKNFIHKKNSKRINEYLCDLSKIDHRKKFIDIISAEKKAIDVMINSASLVGDNNLVGWNTNLGKQSIETWNKALEINLTSIFHLCKGLSKNLKLSKNPSIINISSIYGFMAPDYNLYRGLNMNNPAAYAVSKAGVIQLTRWMASSLAPKVRVNCISPGGLYANQNKIFLERYNKKVLLKRFGKYDDIIGAVIFLSSNLSNYITGQNIIIDGGYSIN